MLTKYIWLQALALTFSIFVLHAEAVIYSFTITDNKNNRESKVYSEVIEKDGQNQLFSRSAITDESAEGGERQLGIHITPLNEEGTGGNWQTDSTDGGWLSMPQGLLGETAAASQTTPLNTPEPTSQPFMLFTHAVLTQAATNSGSITAGRILPPLSAFRTGRIGSDCFISDFTVKVDPENSEHFTIEGYITVSVDRTDENEGNGKLIVHVNIEMQMTTENKLKSFVMQSTGEDKQNYIEFTATLDVTDKSETVSEAGVDEPDQEAKEVSMDLGPEGGETTGDETTGDETTSNNEDHARHSGAESDSDSEETTKEETSAEVTPDDRSTATTEGNTGDSDKAGDLATKAGEAPNPEDDSSRSRPYVSPEEELLRRVEQGDELRVRAGTPAVNTQVAGHSPK